MNLKNISKYGPCRFRHEFAKLMAEADCNILMLHHRPQCTRRRDSPQNDWDQYIQFIDDLIEETKSKEVIDDEGK